MKNHALPREKRHPCSPVQHMNKRGKTHAQKEFSHSIKF
jgi:hypothetical protein